MTTFKTSQYNLKPLNLKTNAIMELKIYEWKFKLEINKISEQWTLIEPLSKAVMMNGYYSQKNRFMVEYSAPEMKFFFNKLYVKIKKECFKNG